MTEDQYITRLFRKYQHISRPQVFNQLGQGDMYHWSETWYDTAEAGLMKHYQGD